MDKEKADVLEELQSYLRGQLSRTEYQALRGSTNPYECLGKGPKASPFMNRSALKLAELNYIFDFHSLAGNSNIGKASHFRVLDVCGGPGGFIEYLLNNSCHTSSKLSVVGMTLLCGRDNSDCNWNTNVLQDYPDTAIHFINSDLSSSTPVHTTVALRNVHLVNGSSENGIPGDIFVKANRTLLRRIVKEQLKDDSKVDLVTADGGFQSPHEVKMLPLLLAQVLVMLPNLRLGGSFVLKLFSCHTVTLSFKTSLIA